MRVSGADMATWGTATIIVRMLLLNLVLDSLGRYSYDLGTSMSDLD